jgi:hypothetical protein
MRDTFSAPFSFAGHSTPPICVDGKSVCFHGSRWLLMRQLLYFVLPT